MIKFLGFVFLVGQFVRAVEGDVHFYDFFLSEKNFTRLCTTKSMLVVNGSFPGPVIRVNKGDTLYVNVYNQGSYGVTIHWHGVKQPRNPWSDGPEYITQCPIEAGSNFTYEVIFSDEEGTLWWHAHSDWTRASVHGAIVVSPATETSRPFPEPDGEEIIVLGSWYSGDLNMLVDEDLQTGDDLPHSIAYTINGEPGDFCACSNETSYRWMVSYGKTYLLRVINAVVSAELFFAIARHNLTVVGMDGHYIKPVVTNCPGQTMDILLTTNQSLGHYYMAALQFWSQDPAILNFDHVNATAILQYEGNYSFQSSPLFPSTLPFYKDLQAVLSFTNRIRSLAREDHPANVPLNITTRMYITLSLNDMPCRDTTCSATEDGKVFATSANNISWVNPSTDVLLAYYRNISGVYTTDFPDNPLSYYNFTSDNIPANIALTEQGTKVKVLNYNEAVEIVFQGTNVVGGAANHPMHLHGYSFFVVGTSSGNFDNKTDPKGFNLVDPPEVNTFGVPRNGWLAIRFLANNPGVWFWHCHMERHLTWGMDAAFIVKNGDTAETSIRQPPAYLPPCRVPFRSWLQNSDGSDEKRK
ncbi:laccase-14-like [Corylus avellana]|uniref:laccase-14-like n=1 Tax=Corylus avellana TaxID=13451 RepID=UPI00286C0AA3|nr:laccase-14-like [Corylus avellana]